MRVQKKSKQGLIIAIVAVVIVITAALTAYLVLSQPSQQNNTSPQKDTSSANKNPDKLTDKGSVDIDSTTNKPETEKDIQPPYEGENPNVSKSLTGVINFKSVIDGTLTIRNTINQALSSGTCDLTMTNGSKTVTKNSGITQNPSSSSCEGFDIPVSELASGSWKVSIVVTSGDRTGTIIDEVTI